MCNSYVKDSSSKKMKIIRTIAKYALTKHQQIECQGKHVLSYKTKGRDEVMCTVKEEPSFVTFRLYLQIR